LPFWHYEVGFEVFWLEIESGIYVDFLKSLLEHPLLQNPDISSLFQPHPF
jgi:hypothetical protein